MLADKLHPYDVDAAHANGRTNGDILILCDDHNYDLPMMTNAAADDTADEDVNSSLYDSYSPLDFLCGVVPAISSHYHVDATESTHAHLPTPDDYAESDAYMRC